ncbi:MAG TPA: STAS domain-containing protein [Bacillota bacterium]
MRVWCAGELEARDCRSLQTTLRSLRRYGRPVIIDVGGVINADIRAAAALAGQIRRLREAGLPALLAAVDGELRETFELIGCDDVLGREGPDLV